MAGNDGVPSELRFFDSPNEESKFCQEPMSLTKDSVFYMEFKPLQIP